MYIFVGKSIKTKCNVFTNSAGLSSAAAQFAFRVKVDEPIFDEVFTVSSGLASKSITLNADFNDSNPAFLF